MGPRPQPKLGQSFTAHPQQGTDFAWSVDKLKGCANARADNLATIRRQGNATWNMFSLYYNFSYFSYFSSFFFSFSGGFMYAAIERKSECWKCGDMHLRYFAYKLC